MANHSVPGRLVRSLLNQTPKTSRGLINNHYKSLIMLMEATTRIELVYTVLQTVA
jgi:hypothetical protein